MGISLALNDKWDISTDSAGNLRTVAAKKAAGQDVTCVCRLFKGEALFAPDRGVPYFNGILGGKAGELLLKAHLRKAALTVFGVTGVEFNIRLNDGRTAIADITVTDIAVSGYER